MGLLAFVFGVLGFDCTIWVGVGFDAWCFFVVFVLVVVLLDGFVGLFWLVGLFCGVCCFGFVVDLVVVGLFGFGWDVGFCAGGFGGFVGLSFGMCFEFGVGVFCSFVVCDFGCCVFVVWLFCRGFVECVGFVGLGWVYVFCLYTCGVLFSLICMQGLFYVDICCLVRFIDYVCLGGLCLVGLLVCFGCVLCLLLLVLWFCLLVF